MLINVNQAVQNSSEVIPHPSNKTPKKYKTRTILNSDKNVKQLRINWKKKKSEGTAIPILRMLLSETFIF